jgi:hypothetical protein
VGRFQWFLFVCDRRVAEIKILRRSVSILMELRWIIDGEAVAEGMIIVELEVEGGLSLGI